MTLTDRWTLLVAVVAAMSCALPGVWLMLRRHSMLGDALSHTALPAIVVVVLLTHLLESSGWMRPLSTIGEQLALFVGAAGVGLLTAFLTEKLEQSSPLDSGAALGVVFTGFFAVGLLLLRLFLDKHHLDADCVFFGSLDAEVMSAYWTGHAPASFWVNLCVLAVNLGLTALFFKELQLAAFDPELAVSLGFSAKWLHYGLLAATSITLTAAFKSVGTILAIGLLSAPPATAFLLTRRLKPLLGMTLLVAAAAAVLGAWAAKSLPVMIFPRLGFPSARSAQTPGMVAVAAGFLFLMAMLFSPQEGLLTRWKHRRKLMRRIAAEDLLGLLFRAEESREKSPQLAGLALKDFQAQCQRFGISPREVRIGRQELRAKEWVVEAEERLRLTETGRAVASRVVRGHRLWESYMQKHFDLPSDHLHGTAHVVEHFLDADLDGQLSAELHSPHEDPHGKAIP